MVTSLQLVENLLLDRLQTNNQSIESNFLKFYENIASKAEEEFNDSKYDAYLNEYYRMQNNLKSEEKLE